MILRSAVAGLGVSLCVVAVGCQVHSSGPKAAGTALRAPAEALEEDLLSEHGLETLWRLPAGGGETPVTMAALLPEGLFLATQPSSARRGRLMRIRREDGVPIWSYDLEHRERLTRPPTAYRYPASSENTTHELYFTQLDTIYVLDLDYGDPIKRQSLSFPVSSPIAAVADTYFVGSDNTRVYAVNKATDSETWSHVTGGGLNTRPIVSGSSVFFAAGDGSVHRFSTTQGYLRGFSWSFSTGDAIVSAPVVYSNWVLVGSRDYKLYCLSASSGSRVWEFLAEAPIEDSPVVYSHRPGQEVVYCIGVERGGGGARRTLFAVRMRDGEAQWRQSGVRRVVAAGRESLYVLNDPAAGRGRTLSALDIRSGEEKFSIDVSQFHFVPTNASDFGRDRRESGRVYLVAEDGMVQAIGEKF